MDTTTLTPAAQRKFNEELSSYHLNFGVYTAGFVSVYQHEDDDRHIVVDTKNSKILKRFKSAETSWNKANRYADDFYNAHRFDGEDTPLMSTLRRSGLAPAE